MVENRHDDAQNGFRSGRSMTLKVLQEIRKTCLALTGLEKASDRVLRKK